MIRASSYKQLYKNPLQPGIAKAEETIEEQKIMSEKLQKKVDAFEHNHGIIRLLKIFNRVIFKIMIKNNLMTSNELRQLLIDDIEAFQKNLLPPEPKNGSGKIG